MAANKTIYLNIVGFNIQINLKPTEWEFAKKLKENEINKYWGGFIIDKPKKINYKINFIERSYLEIYYKSKERKQYIGFFEEMNSKNINAFYQISIFQFQTILRHIINKLLKGNGFILHSSASNINGRAFLFTGNNGAGKSTIVRLLKLKYTQLADDTVILKKENNQYYFYQTPFVEKDWRIKKNHQKLKLGKIYFLKKEKFFKEEVIQDKNLLFKKVIQQFWTENDDFVNKKTRLIYQFTHDFGDFYFFSFAKNKKKLMKFISC